MSRRLAAAVHVQHPASREWIVLEPGDEPGEELAAEITNPDAWEDDEPESGPEDEPTSSAASQRKKTTDGAA